MGHRSGLQERAEPTQQPSASSGVSSSTWQLGPAASAPESPAGGLADKGGVR